MKYHMKFYEALEECISYAAQGGFGQIRFRAGSSNKDFTWVRIIVVPDQAEINELEKKSKPKLELLKND